MRGRPKKGRHPNFKGGKTTTQHGYVLVFLGKDHRLADVRGYVYEHRLVAETKLGRPLEKKEFVHHIDHNRANNEPENLEVYPSIAHHLYHHRKSDSGKKLPDEANIMVPCACGCGNLFFKYDKCNRPRKYISGHNGHGKNN